MCETAFDLEGISTRLPPPVLIVSTIVGRGMFTLGEALRERFSTGAVVEHVAVERCLPARAVSEDLSRYKLISNRLPVLLNLVYKVPIFYYRKYVREAHWGVSDLTALRERIAALDARTVLCISHRPAFWVSSLKRRERMSFSLWGVLGEYGDTLGWRYIFWNQMDGFLSPLDRRELSYAFPEDLDFQRIQLPARRAFYELAGRAGDSRSVLVVCGYWGQGPIVRVLRTLLAEDAGLRVAVVCGENHAAFEECQEAFGRHSNVRIHGVVESLLPLLAECSCIVTKPGISTLLEANAAGRKIFLLKGMPVAEDNNARHAVQHFGAEWFSRESFRTWRHSHAAS
jgi:hypothetical protein